MPHYPSIGLIKILIGKINQNLRRHTDKSPDLTLYLNASYKWNLPAKVNESSKGNLNVRSGNVIYIVKIISFSLVQYEDSKSSIK